MITTMTKTLREAFRLTLLLTAAAGISFSQAPEIAAAKSEKQCFPTTWPHERSSLRPDPALQFGRLNNGFRYVMMENGLPSERVAMYLIVLAGSLQETDNQRGAAHFLEHMLFNGTEHFPPGELIDYFQSIGMSFGGDTNAYTTYDETVYKLFLSRAGEAEIDKGLLVMRDYARGALLLPEEVDRERKVILAEKGARDSAGYRTHIAATEFSMSGTRLPARPVIGITETLEGIRVTDLRSFYDDWYRPDNMVLVMVGDFDTGLASSLIEAHFAPLASAGKPPECPQLGDLDHSGTRSFYHFEPEQGNAGVSIEVMWNQPVAVDTLELKAEMLQRRMVMRILNGRLERMLEDPETPFSSASYYSGIILNRYGHAGIQARTTGANWRAALGVMEQNLRQALEYGFSEQELARVKTELLSDLEDGVLARQSEDSRGLARHIAHHVTGNRVMQSPEQEHDLFAPIIAAITSEQLHGLLTADWQRDTRLLEVTGDASIDGADPRREIASLYGSLTQREVARPDTQPLLAFPYLEMDATGVAVTGIERFEEIGAIRYHFENGLILNLKQNDSKKNLINGALHFGEGSKTTGQYGLALVAEAVVNGSGTGRMKRNQLDEALEASSVSYRFSVEEDSLVWEVRALTDDTETLFQTIQALMTDPVLREDSYKVSMKQFEQMSEQLKGDINGAIMTVVQPYMAGNHSDFGLPTWDVLQRIGFDQVRSWLESQSRNTTYELTLVGDFDESEVVDLASRSLTSLRSHQQANMPVVMPAFPDGETFEVEVESSVDKAAVYIAWRTIEDWEIGRVRRLDMLALVMEDRLRERVREALGVSYSPSVYTIDSKIYSGYAMIVAQVIVESGLVELVKREIQEVARSLVEQPVTRQELERARAPLLTRIKSLVQTNRYWRDSVLALSARYPEQIDWSLDMLRDYRQITQEEINSMAAAYLQAERSASAIVRPTLRQASSTADQG